MSAIWQSPPDIPDTGDVIGYHVEAVDGGIGTIDEASWDTDRAHLVVDTGPWIFGRKVLVPAGMVEIVDHPATTVHLSLTKEQVKAGPEYDAARHTESDHDFWRPYDDYYAGLPGGMPGGMPM